MSYRSSRKVNEENIADNLKECMSERSYKRVKELQDRGKQKKEKPPYL